MPALALNPHLSTAAVLDALRTSGKPLEEWGWSVDGMPLLAARTGGHRQPAIFITAGAHATETAGVHAALHLLEMLDTEHEVHVLPLRDPLGFGGVNRCLSFAAGETVQVPSHKAALDYLLAHSRLLWREGEMYVFKLGDVGFVWAAPRQPGIGGFIGAHSRMLSLAKDTPDLLRPLWGARVMFIIAMPDVEGTGEIGRCFHGVISARGEYLHLNRFFGRDDAPPEVAAVDRLIQTVRPGLVCDLHEGNGSGFWMPIPRPKENVSNAEQRPSRSSGAEKRLVDRSQSNCCGGFNVERVLRMARAFFDYIHARSYPITTFEEWLATDETVGKNYTLDWMKPEPRLPGLFWCNGLLRGEGYGLIDYATLLGIGFGIEAPMERPLARRVDGITHGMLAAIQIWEQTHC